MKGDEERAPAAGCDHYVTKPYSPMQLLRVIRGFSANYVIDDGTPSSTEGQPGGGMAVARIDLCNICKTLSEPIPSMTWSRGHRTTIAIQDLTLRVPDGQTMVVLGPSGCGKTTLLKLVAGLLRPDSGDVRYDNVDVKDLAPGERRIGMVFQNYALYPHFASRTNVLSYFLFRKKTPELDALAQAKYQRTSELMGVELEYLLDRKPTGLSGGEKQRVALGRCITRDAALFLVDEPFANLDQALREKYRVNLKMLLQQFS